jgi:CRISPR/Cas system-associated exonuclease Cas4 (RecB family)
MIDRPHWSYSQLSTYLRCSLLYFFQYVLALPRRTVSSNLIMGSAIHEALARYHRSIQEGRPCDKETVIGTFLKTWIEREAREKIIYPNGDQKDDLMEQAGELLQAYLNEPPPKEVLAVEESYLAPLVTSDGEVLEKPVVAVVDLLTREVTGLAVTDFKTSGRCWSAAEADMSLQANCNVNVVLHHFGEPASFRFTVLVKTKVPKIQQVEANRTESDLGRLGDIVRKVERAIAAEVFFPNETPLNCSTCPFRQPCREWSRPSEMPDLIPLNVVGAEGQSC